MENLVSTKTRPQAESQLSALKKKFSSLDQMIDTGNSIVDGILNYGSNKADSLGISINFNLWLDTDLNISPVDLYIIIGNTMDNAIEACDAFRQVTNHPSHARCARKIMCCFMKYPILFHRFRLKKPEISTDMGLKMSKNV